MDASLPRSFGRYTLLRCLSHNTLGTVYLATDSKLNRPVALKMPDFGSLASRATIDRFYHEARLVAQITHPNLCPIYDVDCQEGIHFLTMAHIEGIPLSQKVGPHQRWTSGQACLLVRKLATALQQLHDLNLVHREIRPDNILLQPDGNPVLLDLGIGAPEVTIQATTSYQAILPGAANDSSDLVALGGLLFQLLTGEPPSPSTINTGGTFVTSSRLVPCLAGIDPGLLSLCAEVISTDSPQRPITMRAFADRLQLFASVLEVPGNDSSLSAATLDDPRPKLREPTWPEPLTQTPTLPAKAISRRLPYGLVIVATLLILGLLAGALIWFWPQDNAQVELRRDTSERVLLRSGSLESVTVEVQRYEVTGPIEIQVVEPVVGVEVSTTTLPRGASRFTLQLRAAPDAPLQRTALRIQALSGNKVRGTLEIPLQIEPQTFRNSIDMPLVLVPAGRFRMGATPGDKNAGADEFKQHDVDISEPFYLGVYEVTQQEYQKVMGTNPSYFSARGEGAKLVAGLDTSRFPAETVSWEDAQNFCARLSQMETEQRAQRGYRLPTEAEWEYACRATTSTRYHFGDEITPQQVRFDADRPVPVGQLGGANPFGLHDMHGNVAEWCQDWYAKTFYNDSPPVDPKGPTIGTDGTRVLRGGDWSSTPDRCRAANRDDSLPTNASSSAGFRVVCTLRR